MRFARSLALNGCLAAIGGLASGGFALAETPAADAATKPTRAEIGAFLKQCSTEADAKGLTVQKGKGEARKAYRRSCMTKHGVAPNKT